MTDRELTIRERTERLAALVAEIRRVHGVLQRAKRVAEEELYAIEVATGVTPSDVRDERIQ